jgi:hypothetical protein
MLQKVRDELGDRVEFSQIKEKFCDLTIYYSTKDDEARTRMRELIAECRNKLIAKGVHPPREEQGND